MTLAAFVPTATLLKSRRTLTQNAVLPFSNVPETSLVVASTDATFEPVLPDTTALVGMGGVVLISIIAAIVWAQQVVPVSRTKLALSKKSGDVKEYLDGLEEDEDRPLEQWLFNDWLTSRKTNAKKEAAIPILKKAKWNSGDNPVLVTSAMLMVGVVVAAITERVVS